MNSLFIILEDFKVSVNGNERLKKAIQSWEPNIVIKSSDLDVIFTLLIRDSEIVTIENGEVDTDHVVYVSAINDVLCEVFSGQRNAANAFLECDLNIFGSDKDKVKLDVIALLVWGM